VDRSSRRHGDVPRCGVLRTAREQAESTGGKEKLGSISKAGNRFLRQLLVVGALAVIRRAKQLATPGIHGW
jgi:transposase